MKIEQYAAFVVLCQMQRTPENEMESFRKEKEEDEEAWEAEGYELEDFEYSIRDEMDRARHYFSRKDVSDLLNLYRENQSPVGFWGEEKARALGF